MHFFQYHLEYEYRVAHQPPPHPRQHRAVDLVLLRHDRWWLMHQGLSLHAAWMLCDFAKRMWRKSCHLAKRSR